MSGEMASKAQPIAPSTVIALVLVGIIVTAGSMGLLYYLVNPKTTYTVITVTVTTTTTETTTLQTVTITATDQSIEREICVLESRGTCGTLETPRLSYIEVSNYVLLIYREQAGAPCYRHVIAQTIIRQTWPPIVDITLKLERTSDTCVKCIGVIETILRVGPLPGPRNVTTVPGGTKITVNGLEVVVSDKREAVIIGQPTDQLEPVIEVVEKLKEALVFRPALVNHGEEPAVIRYGGHRLFDVRVYRNGVPVYDSTTQVEYSVLITAIIKPGEAYPGTVEVELRGWLNSPGGYRIVAWADFALVEPLEHGAEPEYVGLRVERWIEISD